MADALLDVINDSCKMCGRGNVRLDALAFRLKLTCGDCSYKQDNSETADPFFDYDETCPNCEGESTKGDGFDRKCNSCGYMYDVPETEF